jgi:hypothetical protein
VKPADRAWLAIIAAVLAYEIAASRRHHDWEFLSEACDRHRDRHPVVVHGVIGYLAAHLTRIIPRRLDPIHRIADRLSR